MHTTFQGPHDSAIDPDTLRAYHEAEYRVAGDHTFTLHIGEYSAGLATLHIAHRATGSAFITACNPHGRRLDKTENDRSQAALAAELEECGYTFLQGEGADPTGQWPGEPSFLTLGVNLNAARALGRQFQQNAIVWSGQDAIPQLIPLR